MATLLDNFCTDVNANCLLRCKKDPNLLLCGLYQLDSTASDSRIGGIQVLAVVTESPQLTPHLKLLAQIDTPGVFDICVSEFHEFPSDLFSQFVLYVRNCLHHSFVL